MGEPEGAARSRRRSMVALFCGVAMVNVAIAGSNTAGTLVGAQVVGAGWSGVPSAISVLGTAAGTYLLARLMARRGRRLGVVVGYAAAVVGAAGCAAALAFHVPAALFFAIALVGVGNGAAQLSRYAAADLYPARRRGSALSTIVWAGTIGGIVGPSLLAPSASVASRVRLPQLSGVFLLAIVALAAALAIALTLPRRARPAPVPAGQRRLGLLAILGIPPVGVAVVAMIAGQFDMTAVMTMTPVAMADQGRGLTLIGGVLSVHIIGMFALAPLSGRLADRWGGAAVISGGAGVLFLAGFLAVLSENLGILIAPALFLLGYGWNLCFVGASTMLSVHLPDAEQARTHGSVDACVWLASAVASLASGGLLALGGYAGLAIVAGAVTVLPLTILLVARHGALRAPGGSIVEEVADGELADGGGRGARVR
ncbi:MAG: MFS transporter [Candidatus Dormibacteraceae bacterium]